LRGYFVSSLSDVNSTGKIPEKLTREDETHTGSNRVYTVGFAKGLGGYMAVGIHIIYAKILD
jgi:hypothetical protein